VAGPCECGNEARDCMKYGGISCLPEISQEGVCSMELIQFNKYNMCTGYNTADLWPEKMFRNYLTHHLRWQHKVKKNISFGLMYM